MGFGIFEEIWQFFGPKIQIFMGVSKGFGTHIMEKPPRQLVRIVFWSGVRSNGQKCQYLAENASFWPNLVVFGSEKHIAKYGHFWPISSNA